MDRTEENLKGVRSLIMLTLRRRRTHNTCVLDGVRPDGPGLVESILSKAELQKLTGAKELLRMSLHSRPTDCSS